MAQVRSIIIRVFVWMIQFLIMHIVVLDGVMHLLAILIDGCRGISQGHVKHVAVDVELNMKKSVFIDQI